ncbi:hypothetical protein VB713_18150 [Anabaena cylindrica UHCC 0172]|uniref:hypothetical protein n=1 Tax=Anabaena cylindrica TaxID=1165 RepID=UPI002B20E630|nr:hypothetical protein [Anabaena cylindrica]MEA5552869.1 hypothetical protein [Anabaena cylindrica UHCC 0172]
MKIKTLISVATLASFYLLDPQLLKAQEPGYQTPPVITNQDQSESAYDQYMRLGYAAMQRKDYRTASQYFRYALYETPKDQKATIAYWNARNEMKGDKTPSNTSYNKYMEMGYDATEAESYQNALINFQRALKERPRDYYATQAIRNVTTYINRGQKPSSPSDVTATTTLYAGELPYDRYMRLGYAATQRNDFATAKNYFRSALYQRTNDRQATIAYWNAKDSLNNGKGKQTQTEEAYDQQMRLGYDATEREDYQKALDHFQAALKNRPNDEYATQAIRNVGTYIIRGQQVLAK